VDAKDVRWVGSSLDDQRALPPDARRELGFDLRRVQQGKMPRDWKAIKAVGPGVMEIRVRLEGADRLMYIAKYAEAVYVLHVFQKKTQKTSDVDIAIARRRLAIVRHTRERR
jgi:phage-related protein